MKKGYILAVTLGFITLIMGIIFIFSNFSTKIKDEQLKQYLSLQMGGFVNNLSEYLRSIEIDNEMLFYASKLELPLEIGEYEMDMKLQSAHDKISLNHILLEIKAKRENPELKSNAEDRFESFLQEYNLNSSRYLIELFLDTLDKDEFARANKSEIVEFNIRFYNGQVVDFEHLNTILEYYALMQNDQRVFDVPWEEVFSLQTVSSVDINHASYEVLKYLFPDANKFLLEQISKHEKWYEEVDDLPFDSEFKKTVVGSHYGMRVDIKSTLLKARISIKSVDEVSTFSFKKSIGKNSKVYDFEIVD